jgi:hypothetical protein
VASIRIGMTFKKHKNDLIATGFEFDTAKNRKFELIRSAIFLYNKLHMSFCIPAKYKVPERAEWPQVN